MTNFWNDFISAIDEIVAPIDYNYLCANFISFQVQRRFQVDVAILYH